LLRLKPPSLSSGGSVTVIRFGLFIVNSVNKDNFISKLFLMTKLTLR
jgi:hypothetical protein